MIDLATIRAAPTGRPGVFQLLRDEALERGSWDDYEAANLAAEQWHRPQEEWELERPIGYQRDPRRDEDENTVRQALQMLGALGIVKYTSLYDRGLERLDRMEPWHRTPLQLAYQLALWLHEGPRVMDHLREIAANERHAIAMSRGAVRVRADHPFLADGHFVV